MTASLTMLAWASVEQSAGHWLTMLLDVSLKGAVILGVAGAATLAMRKSSATARHLVWVLAMVSLLALPVLSVALPGWAVLPRWIDLESKAALMEGDVAGAQTTPEEPAGEILTPLVPPEDFQGPPIAGEIAPQETAAPIQAAGPTASAADDVTSKDPEEGISAAGVLPWVMLGWVFGVVICLLPLVLGRLSLWRLKRSARPIKDGPLAELLVRTSGQLGLKRPVILLVSKRRPMPMIWGVFRSKLLLPAESDEWSPQRQRVVLLHELAHAARWDCLAKLVAHIACAVYWFNPLVWVAFKRIQIEAESACDDLVLDAGAEPSKYAEHILEIASGLQAHLLAAHSSIAMARKSKLEGRLLAILDGKRNRRRLTLIGVLLGLILVVSFVVPLAILRAQELSNPVHMDQHDNFVVTHTLHIWGQPSKPFYQLEGKTYRDVSKVVARIGSLMKQDPFPHILTRTTAQFQQEQRPIEDLSQRCRDIGFISMEYKYDLKDSPQVSSPAIQPDLAWGEKARDILLGAGPIAKSQEIGLPVRIRYILMNWSKRVNSIRFYGGPSVLLLRRPGWVGGSIRIFGPDGKQLQAAKAAPFPSKGIDIQQGKSYEGFLDLSNYFSFTQLGDYRIVFTLRVHPSSDLFGKRGFAVSSGEFRLTIGSPATQPTGESQPREALIPDADTKNAKAVLDLASGQMLPVGHQNKFAHFAEIGQGDLAYDRALICLRGATPFQFDGNAILGLKLLKSRGHIATYELPALPCRLLVLIGDGDVYEVEALRRVNHGIAIRYSRADQRAAELAIRTKKPFAVHGKVTDIQGRPLAGVRIFVNAGIGTLLPKGRTETAADGTYALRFGPGFHNVLVYPEYPSSIGLQAAIIRPEKEGFHEKDSYRQGHLRIAGTKPAEDNAWGANPDEVLLPDRLRRIDFVMAPDASQPATQPSEKLSFGPVIERVVNHTGENCLIDLDTGKLVTPSQEAFHNGSESAIKWVQDNGIDAGGGAQPTVRGLIGFDIIAFPRKNEAWEKCSAHALAGDRDNALKLSTPGSPVFLSAKGGTPATYVFQTREGGVGILQILEVKENLHTRIRYKMLQRLQAGAASQPATQSKGQPLGQIITLGALIEQACRLQYLVQQIFV